MTPTDFEAGDSEATEDPVGTVFEATGEAPRIGKLTDSSVVAALTSRFAPFLTAQPNVSITFNGQLLDPATVQLHNAEYEVSGFTDDAMPAALRVTEWPTDVGRELYLCDAEGVVLGSIPPSIQAAGFHFTAYLLWDGFRDRAEHIALADWEAGELQPLLSAARDVLRAHFKAREDERRLQQVQQWQREEVYPYEDAPRGRADQAEREVFDFVATSIATHLPARAKQKRFTLRLLREALVRQPEHLYPVLDELFNLTKKDKEDLARLLGRTSLSNLVQASVAVADRLDFLKALRLMVFDAEIRGVVKERTELHKILNNETWIFGEDYSLLVSDKSLDAVLRAHLRILGRDVMHPEPVRREDGTMGIVDMMLSLARVENDVRRHLVVELKAPRVRLGQTEVAQIKSYAEAVMGDPQFTSDQVRWDFWLVSTEMDDVVKRDANQPDKPAGQLADWGNAKIWARTWAEIVGECERRLHYYRERLDHDPDPEHAVDYLNRTHGDRVPPILRTA